MKNGVIPNQNILMKERINLIKKLKSNGIKIIEFPFPKDLEETKYIDYVFLIDTFISDMKGNALILKFAEKKRC